MHILHLTAHLGGGVGKAHAALRAAMPAEVRQTYLLLEEPRDRRYADEIAAHGGEVVLARDLDDVARHCVKADIVQFEFWNHPKLFECLAQAAFPPLRSVFWAHVSGLFRPVIAPGFLTGADRFVFTTPASMRLGEKLAADQRARLSSIGSGFGFAESSALPANPTLKFLDLAPPSALPGIPPTRGEIGWGTGLPQASDACSDLGFCVGQGASHLPISPLVGEMPGRAEGGSQSLDARHPITYLGTVDFVKMHPGFFDAIDMLANDTEVAVWGSHDPNSDIAAKARSMRHSGRIRFMGQTTDPQSALTQSRIFFYPLQPDHYGTAENALIEAMSLGLVPIVLGNPAECAIVEQGVTGFIAASIDECAAILDRLLEAPDEIETIGINAAKVARERYTPQRSAGAFLSLWSSLLASPKHDHDFAAITGHTSLDWYCATQFLPGEDIRLDGTSDKQSKGTLAHFRAAFPDDSCWHGI